MQPLPIAYAYLYSNHLKHLRLYVLAYNIQYFIRVGYNDRGERSLGAVCIEPARTLFGL